MRDARHSPIPDFSSLCLALPHRIPEVCVLTRYGVGEGKSEVETDFTYFLFPPLSSKHRAKTRCVLVAHARRTQSRGEEDEPSLFSPSLNHLKVGNAIMPPSLASYTHAYRSSIPS
jgi:hypothetical protein